MELTIKMNLDNDIFQDGNILEETKRIISGKLTSIGDNIYTDFEYGLFDLNGNTVGTLIFTERE